MIIGWFLWLWLSVYLVFVFVGFSGLVGMFPEGRRVWHLPVQLLCMCHFAVVVLLQPFS